MSARLSDDLISQGIIFCGFQSLNCLLIQISGWKASSNVHDCHLVPVLSPNFQTLSCQAHGSSEGGWAVHSRATVEMYSFDVDSHSLYFSHPEMNFLLSVNVISKFTRKGTHIVRCFFFNRNSPKYVHFWCVLLNFNQLIHWVGSCSFDSNFLSPFQITLILDGIRVNYATLGSSDAQSCLYLSFRSTIKSRVLSSKILQQWDGRIGFDGIMGFDPR